MSRRDVGRAAAAALAGAVLTHAGAAAAQDAAPAPDADTRLAVIEKGIGRTLSDDQRKAVLEGVKGNDDAWAKTRASFSVPDGTEPDFVFTPTPLAPAGRKRNG